MPLIRRETPLGRPAKGATPRGIAILWGAEIRSGSDCRAVFVDQAAESVRSLDVHGLGRRARSGVRPGLGWHEPEAAVRPVAVVVVDVDSEDALELATVDDQDPVEALAPDRADEALGVGVGEHGQLRLKGMVSSELFG
jgi:hypothetical protein